MAKNKPFVIQLLDAMDGSNLTSNERSVLMAQFKFGDHANGRDSFVGEQRVAEYTGVSIATVRRARKALRDKKWLIEKDRGHAITGQKMAPVYWVTIPQFRPATPKPKRAPRNPAGRNQWVKPEVTGDLLPEVKQTKKPSNLEVTGDHPSGLPFRGSNEPSEYVGGNCGEPVGISGSAGADREMVGLKDGLPQKNHDFNEDDVWTSVGDPFDADVDALDSPSGKPESSAPRRTIQDVYWHGERPDCATCGSAITDSYVIRRPKKCGEPGFDWWHGACEVLADPWGTPTETVRLNIGPYQTDGIGNKL